MNITDTLRRALTKSKKSRYRVFKETGISQAALSRFVRGESISLVNASRLAECLELELTPKRKKNG